MATQINAARRLLVAAAPLTKVIEFFAQYGVKVVKNPPYSKFHFGPERFTSVVALKTPYEEAKASLTKEFGTPVAVSITAGGLASLRILGGFRWEVEQGTIMIFASEAKLTSGKTRPNIAVLLDEPWKQR
jgi:hypothetical protein